MENGSENIELQTKLQIASEETGQHLSELNPDSLIGEEQITFFGENHYNLETFRFIKNSAQRLYQRGIRALLVEADSEQDFSKINNKEFDNISELNFGPASDIPEVKSAREDMIKAMVTAGIRIVPVDHEEEYDGKSKEEISAAIERREKLLLENTMEALKQYPKAVVLVGLGHASRQNNLTYFGTQRKELILGLEESGISCKSIFFEGGSSTTENTRVSSLVKNYGLENSDIMIHPNLEKDNAPYKKDRPDIIVHQPKKPLLESQKDHFFAYEA